MGKLVRVLVVIMFFLAAGALVLGIFLFAKREELVGRTDLLERKIIEIAGFIEETDAEALEVEHPARDISPVEARAVDNPDLDDFWDGYTDSLETSDLKTFSWNNSADKERLSGYYERDSEGKIKRTTRGKKSTNGEMREMLGTLLSRVQAQYTTLNNTRAQLEKTRLELEATIEMLNREKSARRGNLLTIVDLENTIARLTSEKAQLSRQIRDLEQEKRELNEEIQAKLTHIAELEETISQNKAEIERLNHEIDKMRLKLKKSDGPQTSIDQAISVGEKGRIVSVDEAANFVVVEFTDEFMEVIKQQQGTSPTVLLYVRHKGTTEDKVTNRINVERWNYEENLGFGTILLNWKQGELRVGDIAFY